MSARMLEELRLAWPNRVMLRAEEVALVLRGKNSRGVVERVRTGMKQGMYGPARQVDGVWQIALIDLAQYIEPPQRCPEISRPPEVDTKPRKRQPYKIGPRVGGALR